jgi:hypothetical protein
VNKAHVAQKALTETRIFRARSSLDRTVARQIARKLEVQTEKIGHCAIYEDELQRIWPLNEENRKAKMRRSKRGELLGNNRRQSEEKPVGVAAVFQRLIPKGEQSGLWTRTATMENVSLCAPMKS